MQPSSPSNPSAAPAIISQPTNESMLSGTSASFSVVATNYASCATNTAPTITVQPASQTNYVGSNVTFTVTATGTAPLSYLWRFNAGAIANTTSAWALTNIQLDASGPYVCWVTNIAGTATSSVAMLTVLTNPVNPPAIQGIPIGTLTIRGTLTVRP